MNRRSEAQFRADREALYTSLRIAAAWEQYTDEYLQHVAENAAAMRLDFLQFTRLVTALGTLGFAALSEREKLIIASVLGAETTLERDTDELPF